VTLVQQEFLKQPGRKNSQNFCYYIHW